MQVDAAPDDLALAGPTSLLHLSDELLDEIIELAWQHTWPRRRNAPCRRLQPCYDRMRFSSSTLSSVDTVKFESIVRARPAILDFVRQRTVRLSAWVSLDFESNLLTMCGKMVNLHQLVVEGRHCEELHTCILALLASSTIFPLLTVLRAPHAPFIPDQVALSAGILASHPRLEWLELAHPELPNSCGLPSSLEPSGLVSSARPTCLATLSLVLKNPPEDAIASFCDVLALCRSLVHVAFHHVAHPAVLHTVIDALPRQHLVRRRELSASVQANGTEDEAATYDRVSLAPFLGSLAGLEDLNVGACCLVFDDDTTAALKARTPLKSLRFLPGFADDPHDVLSGLKRLETSLPRQIVLDQEASAAQGDTTHDYVPCCREEFPPIECISDTWVFPDWMYRDDRCVAYEEIVELGRSCGRIVSGAVVDSFSVEDAWGVERQTYDELRTRHSDGYCNYNHDPSEASCWDDECDCHNESEVAYAAGDQPGESEEDEWEDEET